MTLFVIILGCIALFLAVTKDSERSTSVEESVRLFYYYLIRENWNMVWASLSPTLRAELVNSQRPAIAERGEPGIQQLVLLISKNQSVFSNPAPQLISKHKVPLKQEHLEMLMIHTRAKPGGRVITIWFVRSLHTQGHWFVEEILIHPEGEELPYTLTGKHYSSEKKTGEAEKAVSDEEDSESSEDKHLDEPNHTGQEIKKGDGETDNDSDSES